LGKRSVKPLGGRGEDIWRQLDAPIHHGNEQYLDEYGQWLTKNWIDG
jgi:hypothetical protein